METTTGKSSKRLTQRPGKASLRTLAGLCLGLGMYGMIQGLSAEESSLRLALSATALCCGVLLLLRARNTENRDVEEKENR